MHLTNTYSSERTYEATSNLKFFRCWEPRTFRLRGKKTFLWIQRNIENNIF